MLRVLIATVALGCLSPGLAAAARVHVAIDGCDRTGDGTPDKPFATAGRAMEAVRRRGETGEPRLSGMAFGPGVHSLLATQGMNLNGTAFSGTAADPFLVSGAGQGVTVLSGGARVTGWKKAAPLADGSTVWQASLPANTTYFRQMFVASPLPSGGKVFGRRHTARTKVMQYNHSDAANPKFAVVYNAGQVRSSYHNQGDVLATLYHCWTATTHRIRAINATNRTLTLFQAPHQDIPRCEHASGKRFYVEDAVEELDEAGEFYYDRQTRVLQYLPLPSEELASFEAYVPQLITPMSSNGVSHVTIANLTVAHAAADMAGFFAGDCDGQSATNLKTAAVELNATSNLTMAGVEIAHTGGFGLWPKHAVDNFVVSRSEIHDVGAGGIRIGHSSGANPVAMASLVSEMVLEDSIVHDGGHVYLMGPGILMEQCHNCSVRHNLVHNFFYTGISTGYGFSEWPEAVRDNRIEFNEFHTLGQGVLSDMGCFYTWGGDQPWLLINNNVCHNVTSYEYGGWGLYNDQTTKGVTMTNNVIFNTEGACYHDHEGTNVSLSNNIFIMNRNDSSDGALRSAEPTTDPAWEASFEFHRNIVYSTGPKLFTVNLAYKKSTFALSTFDSNLYWRTDQGRIEFPLNQSFHDWQMHGAGPLGGQDKSSLVEDPLFVDADAGNYSLRPGSPALRLGFQPIDTSNVGPRR